VVALERVTLHVDAGESVGLIGPNGAGKTTLFDCLYGTLRPDDGAVSIDGHDVSGQPAYRRARLGLGRTFQRMELFGGMTLREHLLVADRSHHRAGGIVRDLTGRGRPKADERERVDRVVALLGMERHADHPVESLTLGRGRLVELGRALMTEPRLVLLDEPSSGLDREETSMMGEVLCDIQRDNGMAILLVEHDVELVTRITTRLYVLDVGRIIASGTTDEVLADPVVRQAYLGVTG
jgi:branched-chain amino acid transport system ATP-binding protein